MGAKFAEGFLSGIKVGDISEKKLLQCMKKAPEAEGIFERGHTEFQVAINL